MAVEIATPQVNGTQDKQKRKRNKQPKAEGAAAGAPVQYRVKGANVDTKEEESAPAEKPEGSEAKPAAKRNRSKKAKKNDDESKEQAPKEQTDNGQAPKYRVKGTASPEKAEKPDEKNEKKDGEKKEKPKNLVYQNPFDFKEKKKFKNKQEEYRFGEWRRMPSVYVTLETPIPELPAKEIATPDEAAFHKKQIELENKIKDHYKNADDLKEKFNELVDQKRSQREGKKTYEPKETRDKRQRFNQVNNEKKRIREAIDEIEKNRGELIRKREQLIKFIHPKWNTTELVPKGLKELKKVMETSSGGRKEEDKYIKEIKKLTDSI